MEWGRNPACDVIPFDGSHNASGIEVLNGTDANNYYSGNQAPLKGNRCDHDKNNFKKPTFHGISKRRPHVLEEAKRRIDASVSDHFRYPMYSGLFYHQDETGKANGRQIRSERIEGVHSLALPTLLQTLNLHRMACGYYDNRNEFHFYNYAYIEKTTDQSSIRIKREMRLLQDRGVIKVNPVKEPNNDGSYRTIRVEIEFTDKIFEMLDLLPEFLKDRETSSIKFHEKQERLDRNRQRKSLYRKPSFTSSKRQAKQEVGLKSLTDKLIMKTHKVDKGRGLEIRNRINDLIARGMSVADAMEAVKQQYPPS